MKKFMQSGGLESSDQKKKEAVEKLKKTLNVEDHHEENLKPSKIRPKNRIELDQDIYSIIFEAFRVGNWGKDEKGKEVGPKMYGELIEFTLENERELIKNAFFWIGLQWLCLIALMYETLNADNFSNDKFDTGLMLATKVASTLFISMQLQQKFHQASAKINKLVSSISIGRRIHKREGLLLIVQFLQATVIVMIVVTQILLNQTESEILDLIQNFGAISVLSEIDQWVGQRWMMNRLMDDSIIEEEEDGKYKDLLPDPEMVITLKDKLSLLQDRFSLHQQAKAKEPANFKKCHHHKNIDATLICLTWDCKCKGPMCVECKKTHYAGHSVWRLKSFSFTVTLKWFEFVLSNLWVVTLLLAFISPWLFGGDSLYNIFPRFLGGEIKEVIDELRQDL